MKIAELSSRSGVPLPTIKFYIREGLVPPGEKTAKNQSVYGDAHLERLDLVRALREDAGMSVSMVARVVGSIDGGGAGALAAGLSALERPDAARVDETTEAFRSDERMITRAASSVGWNTKTSDAAVSTALKDAAAALVTIHRAFPWIGVEHVAFYARIAQELARAEIPDDWDPVGAPGASLKYALLGTYLFEPLILAMRRMAHAERSMALANARAIGGKRRAESTQAKGRKRRP